MSKKRKQGKNNGSKDPTSHLSSFYKEVGFNSLHEVSDSLERIISKGYSRDHALFAIHMAIIASANGDALDIPTDQRKVFANKEFTSHLAAILKDKCSQPEKLLQIVLQIVESHIESIPDPHPLIKTPEQAQGCEAMLWRAYDGLKSVAELQPLGLFSGCLTELRAAQEALLLFQHFYADGKRAKAFKIASLVESAETAARFLQFNAKQFGKIDLKILNKFDSIVESLKPYKIELSLDEAFHLEKKGNASTKKPNWPQLVESAENNDTFGTQPHLLYWDIFGEGNNSAHSLADHWNGYCQFEDGHLVIKGSVKGTPTRLPYFFYLTMNDLLKALQCVRPKMETIYSNWCMICFFTSRLTSPTDIKEVSKVN